MGNEFFSWSILFGFAFQFLAILFAGLIIAYYAYRYNAKLLENAQRRELDLRVADKIEHISRHLRDLNTKYWLTDGGYSNDERFLEREIAVYSNIYIELVERYLSTAYAMKLIREMTSGDFGARERKAAPDKLDKIVALLYKTEFIFLDSLHKRR